MPGVVVNTGVRVGPSGTTTAPASTYFVVGEAERGPTDAPQLVRSMTEYDKYFGGYTATGVLYQHIQTFFEEGGTRAYVLRVVNSTATAGTFTVDGRSGSGAALTATAANKGTWASKLGLEFEDGVSANTYRVTVLYDGNVVYKSGDLASNTAAAAALNANVGHLFTSAAGANAAFPAETNGTPETFTNGTENLASITDANVVTALALFGEELGAGAVAAPSRNGSTIWDGLLAHAVATRRVAICAFEDGDSVDTAKSAAANYSGSTEGEKTAASHMAFYWPWVNVPDGAGSTRSISPESFVAAARAKAHESSGPWRPGAGLLSSSAFVSGLTETVAKTTSDALDTARINALRVVDGTVRVYGARSVSADETNWRFITYRDTLNYLTVQSEAALEKYVFSVIDGRKSIFAKVASELVSILEDARSRGGVFELVAADGQLIDRGYSVEVSDAINPTADLASGIVRARVGIRVSSVADIITVTITKSALTTAV